MEVVRKKLILLFQQPLGATQAAISKDSPAKGPIWISRVTIPAPKDRGIVSAVEEVIQLLGDGSDNYDVPTCVNIKGEWVAYRSAVDKTAPEPNISEACKYDILMKDVKNDSVLLYAHGGAGLMGSSATSRRVTSKLASLSGSRVLAIDYRLLPRSSFPAQIADLLLCYLSLLYPPPGSLHAPVPASNIVFHVPSDKNREILFHGKTVPLLLPGGMAFVSPYTYNPEVYPSWDKNTKYDSFPHIGTPFWASPKFKFDEVWPTKPPRADIYCNTSMFAHPLVCAAIATSWRGSPIYIAMGEESAIDSMKMVAQHAVKDGVTVHWEEYECMTHAFMINFPSWKQSNLCYERWITFIKKCLNNENFTTKGCIIGFENLREIEVDIGKLVDLTRQDVVRLVGVAAQRMETLGGKLMEVRFKSIL